MRPADGVYLGLTILSLLGFLILAACSTPEAAKPCGEKYTLAEFEARYKLADPELRRIKLTDGQTADLALAYNLAPPPSHITPDQSVMWHQEGKLDAVVAFMDHGCVVAHAYYRGRGFFEQLGIAPKQPEISIEDTI